MEDESFISSFFMLLILMGEQVGIDSRKEKSDFLLDCSYSEQAVRRKCSSPERIASLIFPCASDDYD